MILSYLINAIIILLCELFTRIESGPVNTPIRTTALFHESPDQDGAKISYKDTGENWSNMKSVFSTSKMASPALICVKGVWLIYENPDYMANSDADVHLFSGNDNCIKPPSATLAGSIQPASPAVFSQSSLTVFAKRNFGSSGITFSVADTQLRQLREQLGQLGSLIVIGSKPWSLISSNGHIICIRPKPNPAAQNPIPICYANDLMKVQVEGFHTVAVTPGCPDEHDSTVLANLKVSDCKSFGTENIETLKVSAAMGRSFGEALECRKNVTLDKTTFTEEQSALILKLIKIRLTHDFTSMEQILWPDDKNDIWKTVPMDTVFDIMIATVPENIVSVPFLTVIREFTIFHLNEIWKEKNESEDLKSQKLRRQHRVIVHLLNKCLALVVNGKGSFNYAAHISESYLQTSTIKDFNEKIYKQFVLNTTMDPVIETAYVVANYAMALCHELFEYRFNFWDNFVLTFFRLYFKPLAQRWKNPTQISPETFRVILSGFGTDVQYKRVALAASVIFEATPNLQPFEKEFKALAD